LANLLAHFLSLSASFSQGISNKGTFHPNRIKVFIGKPQALPGYRQIPETILLPLAAM
jgi:hypothetical protein